MTVNPIRSNVPNICIRSVPNSQILAHFALRPTVFGLQAILKKVHRMTPKWPWILQGQMYPTYVLLVSYLRVPNFTVFHSTTSCFEIQALLKKKSAPNDPKMTLNHTNVPHTCITSIHKSQVSISFALRSAVFEIRPFETSAPNGPKMTLNHTRLNVPNICMTSILESQISPRFGLWPTVFEIQAILTQVHRMTQNELWARSKVPYICVTNVPEFQISSHFPLRASAFEYKVVDNRKCTKWTRNDLEHLTVKSTLYILNTWNYFRVLNFCPFCSTTRRFQDTRLLKIGNFRNVPDDLRLTLKS